VVATVLAAQVRDRAWKDACRYGELTLAHCHQSETGLNYNWSRDYDPLAGSYVESDPWGLAGDSYSAYAYVQANPVSSIDRFGLYPCPGYPMSFSACWASCMNDRLHGAVDFLSYAAGINVWALILNAPVQMGPVSTTAGTLTGGILGRVISSGSSLGTRLGLIGGTGASWGTAAAGAGLGGYALGTAADCAGRCAASGGKGY